MLKHGCTRWQSISRCLDRLLHNWDPLKAYFKDLYDKKTKEKTGVESSYADKKVDAIFSFVRSPTNKLYVLFLNYTVHVYDEVLVDLQAGDPRIHTLRKALLNVLRNVMVRFLKPVALANKPLNDVQYKLPYNQKEDSDLVIGTAARNFLAKKEENHLKGKRIAEFYTNVRSYFERACDYMIAKLPFNEPLLQHAEVTDVNMRSEAKSRDPLFFLDKFPCLLPHGVEKDVIEEEFCSYQVHEDVEGCISDRMDESWKCIGNITENGKKPFENLSYVMRGIQSIPHSSAHCERVFSTVRKNRTEQRACLSDTTLESLLILKARSGSCLDTSRKHSTKTLKRLKSAYYNYQSDKKSVAAIK